MLKQCLALFASLLILGADAVAADHATRKDAEDFVAKAEAFLTANGKEKTLAEINTPNGAFHRGELYVLAYDFNGVVIGHPVNPKLLGRNLIDVPDPDGKFFLREIVETAKTKKSGWVDYRYKNPETGKIESKTTFVRAAGDFILAAGVYKD